MWFIADLIERYTNNVAKTFVKLAAREAEANRRALEDLKARRRTHYAGSAEKQLVTPPPIVHPHSGEPVTAADAGTGAVHVPKGFARPQLAEREDPATLLRNRLKSALTELPMGVRGDVIVRYVDLLIGADRHALEETIDRLARDKKVRVAELQVILAAVLDEEPAMRKKAEHIAVLRRHLLDPIERWRVREELAARMLAAQ